DLREGVALVSHHEDLGQERSHDLRLVHLVPRVRRYRGQVASERFDRFHAHLGPARHLHSPLALPPSSVSLSLVRGTSSLSTHAAGFMCPASRGSPASLGAIASSPTRPCSEPWLPPFRRTRRRRVGRWSHGPATRALTP